MMPCLSASGALRGNGLAPRLAQLDTPPPFPLLVSPPCAFGLQSDATNGNETEALKAARAPTLGVVFMVGGKNAPCMAW